MFAAEPTEESVTRKSKKKEKHRDKNELRSDLETKKIVHTLTEEQRKCKVCDNTLVPFLRNNITTRICVIPAKVYRVAYFRVLYKCRNCDKHEIKANIVKAFAAPATA